MIELVTRWDLLFGTYAVVQCVAALAAPQKHRLLVLAPAIPMMLVVAYTAYAYAKVSNLWPLVLIFASPAATLAVIVIWVASWYARRGHENAAM